jgi:hypothetical protein
MELILAKTSDTAASHRASAPDSIKRKLHLNSLLPPIPVS